MRRVALAAAAVAVALLVGAEARTTVFSDDFEYTVSRTDANAVETFQANGWNDAKTEGDGEPGAEGWLYTIPFGSISGGCGTAPNASTRALAIEARPDTEGNQSDFYLEYGSTAGADDLIPGDVWFQFLACSQDDGSNQSGRRNRNKFLYVCNAGGYPCNDHLWIMGDTGYTNNPLQTYPWGLPADGSFTWVVAGGTSTSISDVSYTCPGCDSGIEDQIGPTDNSEYVLANRWTLVRFHFDTTHTTTGNTFEAWHCPFTGTTMGACVKTHEYIDGVTPDFNWDIGASYTGGHRALRMPTTVGHGADPAQREDYWMYLDDFTIATSLADLPTYGSATAPDAPTIGTATAGNAQCTVTFTPPGSDGGATITGYTATSSPGGITGTAASSPITVTGLSNGTGYTFTVTATNSQGTSSPSSASNSCTPAAVTAPTRIRLRG